MPVLASSSSISSSFAFTCLTIFLLLILHNSTAISSSKTAANVTHQSRQLSVNYYARSCPQLEQLVGSITSQQFKASPVSGPATIRLFFHDCFVEVITTPRNNNAHLFGLIMCMHVSFNVLLMHIHLINFFGTLFFEGLRRIDNHKLRAGQQNVGREGCS